MRRINKKGMELAKVIEAVILLVLLAVLIYILWSSLGSDNKSIKAVSQCGAMGKGTCVSESDKDQKESDGFTCTKGLAGCDSESTTPYCCIKPFA